MGIAKQFLEPQCLDSLWILWFSDFHPPVVNSKCVPWLQRTAWPQSRSGFFYAVIKLLSDSSRFLVDPNSTTSLCRGLVVQQLMCRISITLSVRQVNILWTCCGSRFNMDLPCNLFWTCCTAGSTTCCTTSTRQIEVSGVGACLSCSGNTFTSYWWQQFSASALIECALFFPAASRLS